MLVYSTTLVLPVSSLFLQEFTLMRNLLCVFFFFFTQKTAYELRIIAWSADVCSSDLRARRRAAPHGRRVVLRGAGRKRASSRARLAARARRSWRGRTARRDRCDRCAAAPRAAGYRSAAAADATAPAAAMACRHPVHPHVPASLDSKIGRAHV